MMETKLWIALCALLVISLGTADHSRCPFLSDHFRYFGLLVTFDLKRHSLVVLYLKIILCTISHESLSFHITPTSEQTVLLVDTCGCFSRAEINTFSHFLSGCKLTELLFFSYPAD